MPRIIKSAKGTFNSSTITVDSSGRIVDASSGAGAAVMKPVLYAEGPASGTFNSNGNQVTVYAASGGGGGAGMSETGSQNVFGGDGGYGVQGIFTSDITPPFSQPYAVGGGGPNGNPGGGSSGNDGGAGGATSIANLFSLNAGNGGNNGAENQNGQDGNPGSVGSGSFLRSVNFSANHDLNNTITNTFTFGLSSSYGSRGQGGQRNQHGMSVASGRKGLLYVFDNS
tara:strand:+ start:87 stop:764 length:678 start_codon:yes stop_codon:yes gene_type:complete